LRAGVGEKVGTGGLAGKRPEMARKAIFSKGRALRVRIAMRCASRGTSSLSASWPEAGCLAGTCLGCTQAIFAGVRSPPLRGEASRNAHRLAGKAQRQRGRRFSRRGAVSAPANTGRTQAKLFHSHRMVADDAVANRGHAWVERWCHRGRAEPAPPGGLARVKGLAGKTRRKRGGRFSRRGAVSAPVLRGRAQAEA